MVRRKQSGVAAYYAIILMAAMCMFCSLAVDLGRVQLVKMELHSAADAAALAGAASLSDGVTAAQDSAVAVAAQNKADGSAVTLDRTTDIELGKWTSSTNTFVPLSGAARSTANAVRVTARRTSNRGTAVPLIFASIFGAKSCDVNVSAIASNTIVQSYGVVGLNSVSMNGSTQVDSYDSRTGAYSPLSAGNNVAVASNGDISLTGGANVQGDAHPGINGTVSDAGGAYVTGSTDSVKTPLVYPPVDLGNSSTVNNNGSISPAFLHGTSFDMNGQQVCTLSAGVYYFSSFSMAGGSTLIVTGPVTIYCTGDFNLTGHTQIADNLPANFRLRVTSGNVNLTGGSQLYADVYSPNCQITLTGGTDLFGALVGRELTVSGDGSIHYDESLSVPAHSHCVLVK